MLTFEEILKEPISFITEDDSYYYVKPKNDDKYDHCMWKINKNDLSVEYLDLVDYLLNIDDNVSETNLESLKRAS